MRLRPYQKKDFEVICKWIKEERAHALWCANLTSFPLEKKNFEELLAQGEERFFCIENAKHHEVVFFYLMKDDDFKIQSGVNTDQQNEHLFWLPIEELGGINWVPVFLKTALQNIPKEITRVVSNE